MKTIYFDDYFLNCKKCNYRWDWIEVGKKNKDGSNAIILRDTSEWFFDFVDAFDTWKHELNLRGDETKIFKLINIAKTQGLFNGDNHKPFKRFLSRVMA